MGILERLQQKPEHERRRLFWLSLVGTGLLVVGFWSLTFKTTLKRIGLKTPPPPETTSETEPPETKAASLKAFLGERFQALQRILPLFERTLPGREEIIK